MARKQKLRLIVDADLVEPSFLELIDSLKNVRVEPIDVKGVSDQEIFTKANRRNCHILTNNFKDFLRLFKNQTLRVGVIGINSKLSLRGITPKVVKLLRLLEQKHVFHKCYEINNIGCRVHHRRSGKSKFVVWKNIENVLSN